MNPHLKHAIERAQGQSALAKLIGCSRQYVQQNLRGVSVERAKILADGWPPDRATKRKRLTKKPFYVYLTPEKRKQYRGVR